MKRTALVLLTHAHCIDALLDIVPVSKLGVPLLSRPTV